MANDTPQGTGTSSAKSADWDDDAEQGIDQGQTTQPLPTKKKAKEETPAPAKKIFSRNDIVRSVKFSVHLPGLYPDFEPWGFELGLKMSADAEERRQEYLALSAAEQTIKEDEQQLDELCDLLRAMPTNFGDLQDTGMGPGPSFKSYVMTAEDPAVKEVLFNVIRGAMTLYWRKMSPHEFRG